MIVIVAGLLLAYFDVFDHLLLFFFSHAPPGGSLFFGAPATDANSVVVVGTDGNAGAFNFGIHQVCFCDNKTGAKIDFIDSSPKEQSTWLHTEHASFLPLRF
jgi:hypothetical protein